MFLGFLKLTEKCSGRNVAPEECAFLPSGRQLGASARFVAVVECCLRQIPEEYCVPRRNGGRQHKPLGSNRFFPR